MYIQIQKYSARYEKMQNHVSRNINTGKEKYTYKVYTYKYRNINTGKEAGLHCHNGQMEIQCEI